MLCVGVLAASAAGAQEVRGFVCAPAVPECGQTTVDFSRAAAEGEALWRYRLAGDSALSVARRGQGEAVLEEYALKGDSAWLLCRECRRWVSRDSLPTPVWGVAPCEGATARRIRRYRSEHYVTEGHVAFTPVGRCTVILAEGDTACNAVLTHRREMTEVWPADVSYSHRGDPINYIDPTGLWQIKVNTKGEVVEAVDEGDVDVIDIVDNDGSTMVNANGEVLSLTFEKGTIENVMKIPTKDGSYDIIQVRGDGQASDLFTFLSDNICPVSYVEFSLVKTGIAGNKGLSFVNSGHEQGSEPALSFLIENQLGYNYTLREITHSHPKGVSTKGSDEALADIVLHDRPNCKFYIYHVPTGKMIRFYGDGFTAKNISQTRSKNKILNK